MKAPATRRPGEDTTPAVMLCDFGGEHDYKISPYGPDEPDRECFWVATWAEALEAVEELGGLRE